MNQIGMPHHSTPDCHLRFIGSLYVRCIRCIDIGRSVRNPVESCELSTYQCGFNIFRCTECWRAGFHIDIRGKTSIHHRCSWIDDLCKCKPCERFCVLLGYCASQGDRSHGTSQCERRDHYNLIHTCEFNDSPQHRHVVLQGRIRINDGKQTRLLLEIGITKISADTGNFKQVHDTVSTQGIAPANLVRQCNIRTCGFKMPGFGIEIKRFDGMSGDRVGDVHTMCQSNEIAIIYVVAGASTPMNITHIRRAGDR